MRHLPNLITLLRLGLVPVVAVTIANGAFAAALAAFLLAAVSDFADGWIARRFGLTSRLGALLDPVADKLGMFVATVALAWHGLVPVWLAVAIVGRDVVIVAGAAAYRLVRGDLDIAPTRLSKLNTVVEFTVLLLALAAGAGWIAGGGGLHALFALALATVAASGVQYVWLWGRKALAGRGAR
ncbi:MAG: CDP-alcohol phosphatidyltransferase family protein [Betaproteobacteria bacterium]|nr:CDP-alcohol phosphatidyltransferase family protein [Betaproteobacteria bacterium]MCC7218314.1 CDP-alcohol phosphatidyltransferase family protein [Burkholderiales bacterium]